MNFSTIVHSIFARSPWAPDLCSMILPWLLWDICKLNELRLEKDKAVHDTIILSRGLTSHQLASILTDSGIKFLIVNLA